KQSCSMFKSRAILIISGIYAILLIAFTAYDANHFNEYANKKGDESFIYVYVISVISYLYYLTIFIARKFNVIVIIFVPFVYVLASVGLSIFISLLAGRETTAAGFYV